VRWTGATRSQDWQSLQLYSTVEGLPSQHGDQRHTEALRTCVFYTSSTVAFPFRPCLSHIIAVNSVVCEMEQTLFRVHVRQVRAICGLFNRPARVLLEKLLLFISVLSLVLLYLLHVSYVSHATEQNCLNVALRRDGVDISQVRAEGVMVSAIHM
jgi:hypothetical protein